MASQAISQTNPKMPVRMKVIRQPTKGTIRLIDTFPPGGNADTISRIMAPKLSTELRTHVVV